MAAIRHSAAVESVAALWRAAAALARGVGVAGRKIWREAA